MTKQELIDRWNKRDHSWSQHQAFRDFDKELWYRRYVLCEETPSNKRMDFGKAVGQRIEKDINYIPMLPRGGTMEYGITVKLNKDITLVGYMDQYFTETKHLHEFKTSGPTGWSQAKVDEHGQLTYYALLLKLANNIKPEELTIYLHHMHTCETGDFSIGFCKPFTLNTYQTKRTTKQVLLLGAEIIKLRKEMLEYINNHE